MKAIINGIILKDDHEFRDMALLYDDKIYGICSKKDAEKEASSFIDAHGLYITPGFIDTHVHGYGGASVSGNSPDQIRRIAHELVRFGVTSFLPTTATHPWDDLCKTFEQVRTLMPQSREPDFSGAEILGVHAEGPFINPVRKGAMIEQAIQPFCISKVMSYADVIRVMTIAPELEGGMDFVRAITRETGIKLSLGHTDATYEEAKEAIACGVTRATHLFNAMPPIHHRLPGAVIAALTLGIYTEFIADTFHVSPALYPLVSRTNYSRVVLITDTDRYVDMPEGEYEDNGQHIIVRNGECRLDDGTIAASMLHLNEGIRNYRDYGRVPMTEAVHAASLAPAASIGLDSQKGALAPGYDADIVIMNGACTVLKTIIRGNVKYTHPSAESLLKEIPSPQM